MHSSEILRRRPNHRRWTLAASALALLLPLAGGGQAMEAPSVGSLLDAAETAERKGHLIYPARGSAMSLYHDVLFVDPDNAFALEGLARLAEHYLVQAQAALERGDVLTADSLLSQARMVYPEYPGVATMAHQIRLLETAERHRETLNWQQVAQRSSALTPTLHRLGSLAKDGDCRVTIQVSNDAEGRWVYQQMNEAEGDGRLRAEVKIASPSAVDVLCFTEDDDAEEAAEEDEEEKNAS